MWNEIKKAKLKITLLALITFPPLASASGGEVILDDYWSRPVAATSGIYTHFSAGKVNESVVYPENCAVCHNDCFKDWSGSLHSKAVGPGLLGQLNPYISPANSASCYFCHAPAFEQSEMVKKSRDSGQYINNSSFDNKLKKYGVNCVVCHMRKGKIYGPPPFGSKSSEKMKISSEFFIQKDFFEDSRFCAACHQLDQGYELNGKVLVNTYREWKESKYGKENFTCQNCHMPDRRHLFRGIHDPEMVKKGVIIEAMREVGNKDAKSWIKLTNTGVGHMFPTYPTPLVIIKAFLIDAEGITIEGSTKIDYIGRMVSIDLSKEIIDTRIPPSKSFLFEYVPDVKADETDRVVFEVWIYPDMFYNVFYKTLLANGSYSVKSDIEQALEHTEKSHYLLHRQEFKYISGQQ